MRVLFQALLVLLVALLVSCNEAANPTKKQLTIVTTNSTATAKALQKFFNDDAKQNESNGFLKVVTLSSSNEERASAGAITSGQGPRAGAGTTVVANDASSGETVTVTVYNNNGLWQRFLRWWNRLFTGSAANSTRTLRTDN
ncbi:hypothetical protein F441_22007 [Phytophthora nicotianae CJ01A1]|uniref:RxLR effector protein n=5 Tax=Phytophthora nicotianae TaxID=4792 RepID=W2PX51_PHYN3|nr:hypothetical protein PPTG_14579 [Phytophthora nicotianae INRA-310]ETI40424.1 hypothetical protein F443_14178 [Phytophthora nicotianae P1569]ETK80526.1 hypothetical protein L915_13821 [Phytophthora nicotianae]ETO59563.1 hypothetical protein F444_22129 [Phytophthora nicotianae P1976]ETP00640.1 hypothetical protein F441_22007 [Phytophthora nicotianae CJ01A1]KUF64979.1 hypothetical protein AM587_10010690 [Phytophthora nicotianae]